MTANWDEENGDSGIFTGIEIIDGVVVLIDTFVPEEMPEIGTVTSDTDTGEITEVRDTDGKIIYAVEPSNVENFMKAYGADVQNLANLMAACMEDGDLDDNDVAGILIAMTLQACENFDSNQTNQLLGSCTSAFLENLNAGFI